ncbi:hypothetical protein BX661DRAFT_184796 [Kickxella alabastrina]|uniref:uncharacterized protein n=1 Tax=Kickxella alabastrina TaxID=61397 RepID=UPI00221ECE55|nr:uncharacterized protein BX661DRAFT_184796 [Kickxella alabastrina]KAI7825543.1 hypothetical protein BX661DRAFT_184796 [Kickxella alabastrina]
MSAALSIDDSQPIVSRGFNLDTLLRYFSRVIRSPLLSYFAVNALSRHHLSNSRLADSRSKLAATAALWATVTLILPSVCKLTTRLLLCRRSKEVYWPGEIVVVTGGSHGVGLELTKRLLRANARVAIIDVCPFPLTEQLRPGYCAHYSCDITDLDAIKAAAGQIRTDLGGDPTMLLLLDMSDREVDKVIDVNLTSHFHLIRQFLPAMIAANRGHIVSIGSIVSFLGTPQASTYCASKGGVKLLHESMRREVVSRYKADNVQFSIAYPGIINTGLFGGIDLGQFFMPTLRPDSIARSVFAALASGTGNEISFPASRTSCRSSTHTRSSIINLISSGDTAMATFSGHVKY